jgi:ABC-type branched-subunit amino acid transport system ATPase component
VGEIGVVSALTITALDAFYGDSQILHGVTLSVPARARVAVVGRNGAGKTTLLKSVMGGGPETQGQMSWGERPLDGLAGFERTRLGLSLVPEDRRIFPHLTVAENMEIALNAARAGKAPLTVAELVAAFPMLAPLVQRRGDQLSGGQQQMLAVARGLVPAPDLLLLDEPTEGLAPIIVEQLAAALVAICAARGTGLLLAEQNLWFARRCTTEVHVLDAGCLVFSGTWAAFDAAPDIKTRHLAV